MDESGLFYRESSRSTFYTKGEDCAGGKRAKERITVALCASMTGEKLKPVVIGKARKPRCFGSISVDKLPVKYYSNKTAWMHSWCFEDWYRKRQLAHVLSEMDRNSIQTGPEILRVLNILQAMYWINSLWNEVKAETIMKCFWKCGFGDKLSASTSDHEESNTDRDDIEDDIPLAVLRLSRDLFSQDFNTLADIDSNVHTCDNSMTEWGRPASEILSEMRNSDETSSNIDDEEEEESLRSVKVVSTSEVSDCLDTIKAFALQRSQSDMLDVIMSAQDLLIIVILILYKAVVYTIFVFDSLYIVVAH
ncbi:tigger transposable element-derived protein 4-like [Mya arenaria]|uniref:tigger transposable element-derived protein 4-like n=1 Tax=Mya arenaria TaxID=6604 RepID=UPI0022E888F9|nr:tigger transposable element-derived protein 4-like [Mya arenaria]